MSDARNRVWLSQVGRQLIADLLRHNRQDPVQFYTAYDAMMEYLQDCVHVDIVDKELRQRGVCFAFKFIQNFLDVTHVYFSFFGSCPVLLRGLSILLGIS